MAKKIKITVADTKDKELVSFYSKNLTKALNKLPVGTETKWYAQENDFGKQFVGNYVTKSPANEPEAPTPEPIQCPPGQHEENGKCVDDVVIRPPSHPCPQGQHWDDAQGKCVDDTVTPPPASGTLLYDSDVDIDWAAMDGKKIEIGKPYGDPTKPGTKYIRMNASGSPRITFRAADKALILEHDGDFGRAYFGVINYASRLEVEMVLDSCNNNGSLKTRNMHQYNEYLRAIGQPEVSKPVGGVGNAWKCSQVVNDLEITHGDQGDGLADKSLSPQLEAGKAFRIKFSQFDATESGKIHIIDELDRMDGQGFKVVNEGDADAPSQFFDKAAFRKFSEFWIRLNAKGGGKLIAKHIKMYAI